MCDKIVEALILLGTTGVGTIIGYLLSIKAARRVAFENDFIAACNRFKEKWLPIFLKIKYANKTNDFNNTDWSYETAFKIGNDINLLMSTEIFQRHLKGNAAIKFRSECNKLFEKNNNNDMFVNISHFSSDSNNKNKANDNLLNVVNNILSFSEP